MRRSSSSELLGQIEEGALDGSTPLADVLRYCVALGGRTGSGKLRDWARRELDGYGDGTDELPRYRIVPAPIAIDGADLAKVVRGQQISTWDLPEFARDAIKQEAPLSQGVAQLEQLAANNSVIRLQDSRMPDLVKFLNKQAGYGTTISSMYWQVSPMSVRGVLDSIRTSLVSLVAEMETLDHEGPLTATAADQAVNVVINGAKRSTIHVNTNQSSGADSASQQIVTSNPSAKDKIKTKIPSWIRGPWGIAVGAATIIAAGVAVVTWLGWNPFG